MSVLHVMLDVETLGRTPNAALLSIGAVAFRDETILDRFHYGVDPQSSIQAGGSVHGETVLWWLAPQLDGARRAILALPRGPESEVLQRLLNWFAHLPTSEGDALRVWGNGAMFDITILESALQRHKKDAPWKSWEAMCYRSVAALRPSIKKPQADVPHDAASDAEVQAKHLMQIFKALKLFREAV